MDNLLIDLGNVIEELWRYKQDSDCFEQQQDIEQMITTLNKVYDHLVHTGAQYELHYSTTKSYP